MTADEVTLELVIQTDRDEREVGIRFGRGTPVATLIEPLARLVGAPSDSALYLPRLDRQLDPAEALEAIPLLRGDTLWIGDPSAAPPQFVERRPASLQLVVVGGPAMGTRHPLTAGVITVGRARDCDVVVEDAAMSRRHLRIEIDADVVRVSDAGSTNGTYIDGRPLGPGHQWAPGEVIEAGASLLSLERDAASRRRQGSASGTIAFNRPPRVRAAATRATFDIPAPPQDVEQPRVPLIAAGVPLLVALILWQVFPGNPAFLVLLTLSPLIALFSYFDDRRRRTKVVGESADGWRRSIDALVAEIESARAAESARLRDACPGAAELERRAVDVAPALWLRRPDDADFLTIRYGWGDRSWDVDLRRQPGGAPRLRDQLDERLAPLEILPSVPLTFSLTDHAVVGLAGDAPAVEDAARWWVTQLAVLHAPHELRIVVAPPADDTDTWRWVRWLPHATDTAAETADDALATLADAADAAAASTAPAPTRPATVVLIHERSSASRALTARILRNGKSAGIHVIWVGAAPEALPGESLVVVEVSSEPAEAVLTRTSDGSQERGTAEGMDLAAARRIALALAPIVDAAGSATGPPLPRSLSLSGLYGQTPSVAVIQRLWEERRRGLSATVGMSGEGPFALDLVNDGPHALIGGMTGSGKSELLRTLVGSLAATYTPTQLNLLMIDYKGGAAFAECVELPHAVGFVTDLDPATARRALISLNAEVRRRETELRARNVSDIREIDEHDAAGTMPRLVIVIDEFATLVKELPGFVDGVVDIAQRGRSLGLHLVLATQRPAGVVSDAIRANTDLRICLRVADEADSVDVLGIPAAARIPRSLPGRAYVRTGNAGLVELQVARASAPALENQDAVRVWDLHRNAPPDDTDGAVAISQLAAIVAAARSAGAALPSQRSPWLPPLPEIVGLDELAPRDTGTVIGLADEPHLQRQESVTLDLTADGGLIVYGTGRSGKTTLLTTIAASLASTTTPEELTIYGLDMTSGPLRVIQTLPHCGDVVPGDDIERVRRLLFMLLRELDRRKTDDGGGASPPTIVVLVDGYAAFASAYERIDLGELADLVPRLISDGKSVGIHFVLTAERRAAVPGSVSSMLPRKVVLRQGDHDDYAAFGLPAREIAESRLPAGRGFIDGTLFQGAVVTREPGVEAVQRHLEKIAAPAGLARRAMRVEGLPAAVDLVDVPASAEPWMAPFGIIETDFAPAVADLRHGHFLIAGPYRSGRSTALASIASALRRSMPDAELHMLAPRNTPVTQIDLWTAVARGGDGCADAADALARRGSSTPIIVFVDDGDEIADGAPSDALERLAKAGRDGLVRIVAAAESRSLHRAFGGWLAELRKDKQGLLLEPDLEIDGDLLGARLPRRSVRFPAGRGYLVRRGAIELVQVARP